MAAPIDLFIPGAPSGHNCRITAGGYGTLTCCVTELAYPLTIINGSQTESISANRRVFYPVGVIDSDFTLTAMHLSWDDRQSFNAWLHGWVNAVVSNARIDGSLHIEVPVRQFVRQAVPKVVLSYGEDIEAISYTSKIEFSGATDSIQGLGTTDAANISFYKPAPADTVNSPFFYPSGTQVSGAESLDGTIFDVRDFGAFTPGTLAPGTQGPVLGPVR